MWMRIDDGLHAHRKTRAVTKGHPEKMRDSAPMGLWVLAGSWSALHNRDGWVPVDELDRFDDEWEPLAKRLVASGYWWPETRNDEDGYGFNDWQEWNNPDGASVSGLFGNHVRWHVNKDLVKPDCEHCPQEPDRGESPPSRPDDRPDIAPTEGRDSSPRLAPESLTDDRPDSLTQAQAIPKPTPNPETPSRKRVETDDRFEEFWETYSHKVDRKKAHGAYRAALKKPGVTADLLITAAGAYIAWQMSEAKHPKFTKHPTSWLHGENWRDERPARATPRTRVQEHLALVQQLGQPRPSSPFEIGPAS